MRINIIITKNGIKESYPIYMDTDNYEVEIYGQKFSIICNGDKDSNENVKIYHSYPGNNNPHVKPVFTIVGSKPI
jgi:hypothetical protein